MVKFFFREKTTGSFSVICHSSLVGNLAAVLAFCSALSHFQGKQNCVLAAGMSHVGRRRETLDGGALLSCASTSTRPRTLSATRGPAFSPAHLPGQEEVRARGACVRRQVFLVSKGCFLFLFFLLERAAFRRVCNGPGARS